jgi:aryl carrier-like protein
MLPLHPQDGPALFARMLRTQGQLLAIPADWQAYTQAAPADAGAPILRELLGAAPPSHPSSLTSPGHALIPLPHTGNGSSPAAATAPHSPPASDLEQWLTGQVAKLLDLPAARLDRNRPVNRLGIDSLMAAELSTMLRREHGHDLTVPRILKAPGIAALAAELSARAIQ